MSEPGHAADFKIPGWGFIIENPGHKLIKECHFFDRVMRFRFLAGRRRNLEDVQFRHLIPPCTAKRVVEQFSGKAGDESQGYLKVSALVAVSGPAVLNKVQPPLKLQSACGVIPVVA